MNKEAKKSVKKMQKKMSEIPENIARRYIVEYGLAGRVKYAVNGCNTIEDLRKYLKTNPHPNHNLVSSQFLRSGNVLLIWERK